MYLQKAILTNFKKFRHSEFNFDNGINIAIGHNGSGKSTILQAIDIALNQRGNGDWKNSSEYGTLLNIDAKQNFLDDAKTKYVIPTSLPSISVELFFYADDKSIHSNIFNGTINSTKKLLSGLTFSYSFDDRFSEEYDNLIKHNNLDFIPFEFYQAQWLLFSGQPYTFRKNPFKSILIDTDKVKGDSYRSFTHQFFSTLDDVEQHDLSLKLKKNISNFNSEISKLDIGTSNLGVDPTRIVIQDTLEVFDSEEKSLLLRDMGSGEENIIKTNLAMSSKNSTLVLLEEPENHLSFDLARKQINKIQGVKSGNRQVIVSTHSPLLASKLSIGNLKWLNDEGKLISFKDVPKDTAEFFLKADNIDILQVILAKKVVLVEGATEYMLMQDIIKNTFGKASDELGIHIVSMGGNYYKRFKDIVTITKNRVLVITDNDGNQDRIKESKINSSSYFHVAMPSSINNFTFEVALYQKNKDFFEGNSWGHKSNTDSWKSHSNLDKKLVWLLNNKADAAFEYSKELSNDLQVPDYIKEGLEWLQK
ncbi:AAA family ATPase [Lentilactobacillus hilgardii]|nr:AAA family ATPase [Lentilactobacillus hilgardii]MCV3739873.1 AAA family ATPase [Lentilactobacillus hilgardii]